MEQSKIGLQSSEARMDLPELLDEVERGETLVFPRLSSPSARLVPENDPHQSEIDKAIAGTKARRRNAASITIRELLSARDEGRKR